MVDISVSFAGVKLESPLVVAPGPLTKDGLSVKRAAEQLGVGAVVVKTVYPKEDDTPRPSMAALKGSSMINHDWSALSAEQFSRQLKVAKEGQKPVIISILGGIDDAVKMAKLLEGAGADMLELPIGVPPLEQLQDDIRKVKEAVGILVGVKIGPDIIDIPKYAKGIEAAGADYISGINTLGPALAIDLTTGKPLLGSKFGFGYLSGPAIKPIALRCVAEMARSVRIPVLGGGGVSDGRDAVEFIMAGATCVHLHTAAILKGLGVFARIAKEIEEVLDELGYGDLGEVRGMSLKFLKEEAAFGLVTPTVDPDLCNGCGVCERACVYHAIKVRNGLARADEASCFGCGLCKTVCPAKAIMMGEE